MEILATIIACLSLILAVYVGIAQVKLQRRMLKIEEGRDEAAKIANQRASLTCALVRVPGSQQMRTVLRIANDGAGEARNVKVTIDGTPLAEHPCVLDRTDIPVIGSGAVYDIRMVFSMGSPTPPFEVSISWVDDIGAKDPPFRSTVNW